MSAAVGAKPGRMKGNKQKAEYGNRERTDGKPVGKERGKQGSESGEAAPIKPLRGRNGKNGKEETEGQVAGGGTEGDERNRKGSGKARKRKQKGSTRGTAVGSEARKGERKQTGS